jgi:hypothetical protein
MGDGGWNVQRFSIKALILNEIIFQNAGFYPRLGDTSAAHARRRTLPRLPSGTDLPFDPMSNVPQRNKIARKTVPQRSGSVRLP